MAIEYICFYRSYLETLSLLNNEQLGKVIRAAAECTLRDKAEPDDLSDLEALAFRMVLHDAEVNKAHYEEKCRKNRENIQKRYARKEEMPSQADNVDTVEHDSIQSNTNATKDREKEKEKDNAKDRDRARERDRDREKAKDKEHPSPASPPTRRCYGDYENVLLSDEEFAELQAKLPDNWRDYIDRLSDYMASSGKSYSNHLATMLKWWGEDKGVM